MPLVFFYMKLHEPVAGLLVIWVYPQYVLKYLRCIFIYAFSCVIIEEKIKRLYVLLLISGPLKQYPFIKVVTVFYIKLVKKITLKILSGKYELVYKLLVFFFSFFKIYTLQYHKIALKAVVRVYAAVILCAYYKFISRIVTGDDFFYVPKIIPEIVVRRFKAVSPKYGRKLVSGHLSTFVAYKERYYCRRLGAQL